MSHSPIGLPTQAGNPYLVSALHQFLGDQRWSFERLALMMRWNQESRAEISEVALGLGLITQASLAVKVKAIKARPLPVPQTADILILPVPLRPRTVEPVVPVEPPVGAKQSGRAHDRHEPEPWVMEGLAEIEAPASSPVAQPNQPAPWFTEAGGDDDGQ